MHSNKNAWIRYRALDACFRNTRRKYYIEDLEEVVNQTLEDDCLFGFRLTPKQTN